MSAIAAIRRTVLPTLFASRRSFLPSLFLALCLPGTGCGPRLEQSSEAKSLPSVGQDQPAAQRAGENWPGFHGLNGTGISSSTQLPAALGNSTQRWHVSLAEGNSSPVIWGDTILLTTAVVSLPAGAKHRRVTLSVIGLNDERQGEELWRIDRQADEGRTHGKNGHASASVATDGNRAVAFFGDYGLICCDLAGELKWEYETPDLDHHWGTASSPVIFEDLVIQVCDREEDSYLLALKLADGKEAWRVNRESTGCWSTPAFVKGTLPDGTERMEMVVNGGEAVIAYDPRSGEELWRVEGTTSIVCPTPLIYGGLIYSTSGRNGPVICIRPGGSGDVTDSHVVWSVNQGAPYVPTGVVYRNRVFTINDNGVAMCWNAGNGEEVWKHRIGGSFTGSIVAGDGKLYAADEDGTIYTLAAADKFQELSRHDLGEKCLTTPALSDGKIYVRTENALYCFRAPTKVANRGQ